MTDTLVLTGPIGVGKSTQGRLLAERLGRPLCVYDEIKDRYRYPIGLSREKALQIHASDGVYAMLQYMNEYKSQILQPIIEDHPGHIIDLGAGAHAFDEPHQVARARAAFDLADDVILLMPSDDLETNVRSLPGIRENYEVNTFLIMHPTNALFATGTVYTLNKAPAAITAEILRLLGG